MPFRCLGFAMLAFVPMILLGATGFAQCSDAGACTISRHAGMAEKEELIQTVGVRYTFGQSGSPDDVTYHSFAAEATLQILPRSSVIVAMPFNMQSGPLGNAGGIGDLIAIWEQTVLDWAEGAGRATVQAGGRFGTGDANAEPMLPMSYQPGLGSTDFIFGASASYAGWSAGGAYQIAGERNDNELVRLKRGDQLVLWASYEFVGGSTRLLPGVMVIGQLQESSIRDTAAGSTGTVTVAGSDQVQVNVGLRARHRVSSSFTVEIFGAVPLRARDVNVDGLKRAVTLSIALLADI